MAWLWTPARRADPELMDAPGLAGAEVIDAYRVLERVNRQLGNQRTIVRECGRLLDRLPAGQGSLSILDVGSGSADLPAAAAAFFRSRNVAPLAIALDRDPTATALARARAVHVVRADALHLPFPGQSIDLVTACKFAHHFTGPPLFRLVSEMARVARRRVMVLDIVRHRLAYWGFVAWSRLLTRNRFVRYDGPLSVLRGFTADELLDVARPLTAFSWTVRRYPGFQVVLVGHRLE